MNELTPGAGGSSGHFLDFFQFRSPRSKVRCHLDHLTHVHEILRIGEEFLDAGTKLTATHTFRYLEIKVTFAFWPAVDTQLASYHFV